MTTLATAISRSAAVRFIVNRNPFYVLSAMCMLAGLFILNDSLHYSPIPPAKLITLIATLNVYEWFIIGLSVLLLRRGVLRDGRLILLIEAFFLADVAFLNAELFTASPSLAWPISLVLLGLACAKLFVILRALKLRDTRLVLFCSLALILLLFAIPGVLFEYANRHGGQVPAPMLYAIWWIVGLLPALAVCLPGSQRLFAVGSRLGVMRAFILIPYLSLIAHVAVSHWVYKTSFYSEDLTPILLGLAVFAARYDRHEFTRTLRLRAHIMLPIAAVVFSLSQEPFFTVHFLGHVWTPMRIAFAGAILTYMDGAIVFQRYLLAIPAAACLVLVVLGSSPRSIADNASQTGTLLGKFLPTTNTQWGILSLAASFLLLAVGAAISFTRGIPQPVPTPPPLPEEKPSVE